ncbi:ABC transporter ATP-binding protein [Dyella sp. 2HG41-7]|uniref:ABC transporter ATP-binding protein n=1 Tax=Dyella sp. 2HG41-7 TaxID=2883239 RepID=UPI001F3F6AFD|nr:ABC transporter ATP-binding protein [Dyella sp. 2HG41-7]
MSFDEVVPAASIAVSVKGLSKRYDIYASPQDRLKQMVIPRLRKWLGRSSRSYFREFWALNDVSFDVRRGEAVGVIGRNGSGKSTLLQIVCGTLEASNGEVRSHGRIAALLELGAGFNPEFTGKENVFLSGLVYGIPEETLKRRYQEIVDFAEIGEHIDQPVKTYSSGMYVRLAFAVAAFCDPDVLIIDEALSVGDVYFQRKCFKRINELREGGCTLLFVTHSLDTLMQLCDRGIVIDRGNMVFDGPAKPAVTEYLRRVFGSHSPVKAIKSETSSSEPSEVEAIALGDRSYFAALAHQDLFAHRAGYNRDETRLGDGSARALDFVVEGQRDVPPIVNARERFRLLVRYGFEQGADRIIFGMQVRTREGSVVYSANSFTVHNRLFSYAAGAIALIEFDLRATLLPGQYFVTVGVSQYDDQGAEIRAMDRRVDAIILTIIGGAQHTNGIADMELDVHVTEADSADI